MHLTSNVLGTLCERIPLIALEPHMISGTNVTSFVLRFVYDQPSDESPGPAAGWHGLIRHVQSNEEQRFTRWTDATAFIARYVNVGEDMADINQES